MGEVIKFPFGGTPSKKEVPSKQEQEEVELDMEHFTEMVECLTALVNTDARARNIKNIGIRTERIQDASPEELVAWANGSTELDWKQRPSFYIALVQRIREEALIER